MKVNIDTSDMLYAEAWRDFKGTDWKEEINVRDFIQHNYTPYEGMNLSRRRDASDHGAVGKGDGGNTYRERDPCAGGFRYQHRDDDYRARCGVY